MKRVLLMIALVGLAGAAMAQPKARRNQQQAQQQQQQQNRQGQMTQRARLQYPTAVEMPEDVVWRRDVYREIDLNVGNNGGLYYPVQPKGRQMNLFTYIFKLAQSGYMPIYEYSPTESEERFDDSAKRTFKDMLDDQGVFYEEKDGKIVVDNSDIPSEEVRRYFLKESYYYDQANSTFHRKVVALCPVRMDAFPATGGESTAEEGDDDFSFGGDLGGGDPPRPMFWVNFAELAPFLNRQSVMISDKNNSATMSLEDFFTLNKYEGKIYKVTNMLGRNLSDYCRTDSALTKEQQRIEAELAAFRDHIFGDKPQEEATDSVSSTDGKAAKAKKQRTTRQPKEKAEKVKRSKSSSSSSGGSISVRRQRH